MFCTLKEVKWNHIFTYVNGNEQPKGEDFGFSKVTMGFFWLWNRPYVVMDTIAYLISCFIQKLMSVGDEDVKTGEKQDDDHFK